MMREWTAQLADVVRCTFSTAARDLGYQFEFSPMVDTRCITGTVWKGEGVRHMFEFDVLFTLRWREYTGYPYTDDEMIREDVSRFLDIVRLLDAMGVE